MVFQVVMIALALVVGAVCILVFRNQQKNTYTIRFSLDGEEFHSHTILSAPLSDVINEARDILQYVAFIDEVIDDLDTPKHIKTNRYRCTLLVRKTDGSTANLVVDFVKLP